MEQYIKELEMKLTQAMQRIESLEQFASNLTETTSIPYAVEMAIRDRFQLQSAVTAEVSSKNADSEDVTVNEAGAATYAVMNDPVGFLSVTVNGTTYYVPYFNA